MSGPLRQSDPPAGPPDNQAVKDGGGLFSALQPVSAKRGPFLGPIAALSLVILVGVFLVVQRAQTPAGGAPPDAVLPADLYAGNMSFSQLAMSDSTSLSGAASTFIDGNVKNLGGDALVGVTMQVLFKNDQGLAPTIVTLPLSLIRTHVPYVDTEAVSAAPLKPGDEAEFRLILETVPGNWNRQMPELRVVHVAKR